MPAPERVTVRVGPLLVSCSAESERETFARKECSTRVGSRLRFRMHAPGGRLRARAVTRSFAWRGACPAGGVGARQAPRLIVRRVKTVPAPSWTVLSHRHHGERCFHGIPMAHHGESSVKRVANLPPRRSRLPVGGRIDTTADGDFQTGRASPCVAKRPRDVLSAVGSVQTLLGGLFQQPDQSGSVAVQVGYVARPQVVEKRPFVVRGGSSVSFHVHGRSSFGGL